MIECISNGLSTTNGDFPQNGCTVSELVAGTNPLGGFFKICLDTRSLLNDVISVLSDSCTDYIRHNAVASAEDSENDGSSMEEKLEKLENIGDALVTRVIVDYNNGGYIWTVRFLHDVDGPCQQRDDFNFLCNSPGNIPKLCHQNGSTSCDVSLLLGTCDRPGLCSKLTVIDESDYMNDIRPSGSNTIQLVLVKDYHYNG